MLKLKFELSEPLLMHRNKIYNNEKTENERINYFLFISGESNTNKLAQWKWECFAHINILVVTISCG